MPTGSTLARLVVVGSNACGSRTPHVAFGVGGRWRVRVENSAARHECRARRRCRRTNRAFAPSIRRPACYLHASLVRTSRPEREGRIKRRIRAHRQSGSNSGPGRCVVGVRIQRGGTPMPPSPLCRCQLPLHKFLGRKTNNPVSKESAGKFNPASVLRTAPLPGSCASVNLLGLFMTAPRSVRSLMCHLRAAGAPKLKI